MTITKIIMVLFGMIVLIHQAMTGHVRCKSTKDTPVAGHGCRIIVFTFQMSIDNIVMIFN